MAKTATDTSIGPNSYGTGLGIFDDGIRTLVEGMNYSACEATTTYFSFSTDPDLVTNHDGANHFGLIRRVKYQGQLRIDPDVQEIRFTAEVTTAASNDVAVYFTLGPESFTLLFDTPSSTYELSDSVLTADTGTGLLFYSIETEATTGTGAGFSYLHFVCEGLRIAAADLPDPTP